MASTSKEATHVACTEKKRKEDTNTPPNPQDGFEEFWQSYPRKTAKQDAAKAWGQLSPDEALIRSMLQSLEKWRQSEQWIKDDGKYIPYPATWLRGRRWEDEVRSAPASSSLPGEDALQQTRELQRRSAEREAATQAQKDMVGDLFAKEES